MASSVGRIVRVMERNLEIRLAAACAVGEDLNTIAMPTSVVVDRDSVYCVETEVRRGNLDLLAPILVENDRIRVVGVIRRGVILSAVLIITDGSAGNRVAVDCRRTDSQRGSGGEEELWIAKAGRGRVSLWILQQENENGWINCVLDLDGPFHLHSKISLSPLLRLSKVQCS